MVCLILDPRFKSLCLISSFISHEKTMNIVEKYVDGQYIPHF
jgi:hypothetical protein